MNIFKDCLCSTSIRSDIYINSGICPPKNSSAYIFCRMALSENSQIGLLRTIRGRLFADMNTKMELLSDTWGLSGVGTTALRGFGSNWSKSFTNYTARTLPLWNWSKVQYFDCFFNHCPDLWRSSCFNIYGARSRGPFMSRLGVYPFNNVDEVWWSTWKFNHART